MRGPPIVRFFNRITVAENGCWLWDVADRSYAEGYRYGQIYVNGRNMLAHVYAYESMVGPIPEGMEIDHLCRTPACVNPDHLEPVTHRVNMLRGNTPSAAHAAQTHCVNGHEFDETNTYRPKRGGRMCRTCSRERQAGYREKSVML